MEKRPDPPATDAASQGIQSWHAADMDRAEQLFREALLELGELNAPESGSVLHWIAKVHMEKGHLAAAEAAFRRALGFATDVTDRATIAVILLNYASLLKTVGKTAEALAMYRRSGELAADVGNHRAHAHALGNTANVLRAQGELDQALELRAQALEILHKHGTPRDLGNSLVNLGNLQREMGRLHEAEKSYANATNFLEEAKADRSLILARLNRAYLLMDANRLDDAADLLTSALTAAEAAELPLQRTTGQVYMARLELKQGETDAALELAEEVVASSETSESTRIEAILILAQAQAITGEQEQARQNYTRAFESAHQQQARQLEYEALCRLAELSLKQGEADEAALRIGRLPAMRDDAQVSVRFGLPTRIRLALAQSAPELEELLTIARTQLSVWEQEGDLETAANLKAALDAAR